MKVTTNSKLIQLCMLAALLLLPASLFSSVKYDVVVAQDGTGDYCTVQAAVDAAPANRTAPWTIYIKPGVYVEHVDIPANKPFLSLVGESRDRVRITDNRLCGGENAYHPKDGATVVAHSSDLYFQNISFENGWGVQKKDGPQALALYTMGDRTVLYHCGLYSFQDTYLTTPNYTARHYLKDCIIEGAVDFIYGQGDVLFDGCLINIVKKSGGWIVAPCHVPETKWGYVFLNTTITAPGNPVETTVWLGRPWHQKPKTVYINTTALVNIPEEGWFDHMGGLPALWADYNTRRADGSTVALDKRRDTYYYTDKNGQKIYGKAKNHLTPAEAARYTVKNVMGGKDGWNPQNVIKKYSGK